MIQLKALGGLRLESSPFTQPKPLLLLTYLAVEGVQQRKHLAELFWQDGDRMKSLGVSLMRLRQGLGEGIESDDKKAWSTVPSDVKVLLEALDKSQWQEASELYTGAFLEGVVLEPGNNELEEWVYSTREYLAERVQHTLLNLAEDAAQKQDFTKAGELAERAYKLPGLAGTDLNNLKRLYPLLCAGNNLNAPEVRKEAENYGVTLQLTTQEARAKFKPATKSSSTLPVRGTSFVGRDEELSELATLLNKPNLSLLTLLGPAGVGKTRLALQLAHEQQKLNAFKDGVYFVSLDALNDSSLIASSLLSHFGLTQQGKTEPLVQLSDFFAEKSMLLVLDNFEHLSEGSSLLSELLSKCPKLILLVTSRERLNLEEEHVFVLEGLPFARTPTDDATLSNAVQLFGERAQQVLPHFDVDQQLTDVIRICELVEGLPLGIELSASWVRLMSCKEIATEIERGLELLTSASKNIPERHRSLEATFEQSWKLLTSKEQQVLRKLSVFVGGFRREAASEVAGATIPILASLVDKSLLRVLPNGRYDRHPLLYQFTQEKLADDPHEQSQIQKKHASYFLDLAKQAEPHLRDKEQQQWFRLLDEDLDNIRHTLSYWNEQNQPEKMLEVAGCLGQFWFIRGYLKEGLEWLQKALPLSQTHHTAVIAKSLLWAGDIAWSQGDAKITQTYYESSLTVAQQMKVTETMAGALYGLGLVAFYLTNEPDKAKDFYERCRDLAKREGNTYYLARALGSLGAIIHSAGDYENSRRYYEESLKLFEEIGNVRGITYSMNDLANIYLEQGEHDKAQPLYLQTLKIFCELGDKSGTVQALINLGEVANIRGEYKKAIEFYQEALQTSRELGNKRGIIAGLIGLGNVWCTLAEYQKAKDALEESLQLLARDGNKWQQSDAYRYLAMVYEGQDELIDAKDCYEKSLAAAREVDDKWGITYTLFPLAVLYIEQGNAPMARALLTEALTLAREMNLKKAIVHVLYTFALLEVLEQNYSRASYLFGYTEAYFESAGIKRTPSERLRHEHSMKQTKDNLGGQFGTLFLKGKKMTLEHVLERSDSSLEQPPKTPLPQAPSRNN